MRYSIRVTSPALAGPISLEDAKAHLGVTSTDDDALIAAQLAGAVDHVERFTGHVLADSEWEIAWSDFPCHPEVLHIPREPVTSIVSLIHDDSDGNPVTLVVGDDYRWSAAWPDIVQPALRGSWPSALGDRGSVRLRFRAGYAEDEAPPALVAAVKLMLGHLYANREQVVTGSGAAELPMGVQALCAPFRKIVI